VVGVPIDDKRRRIPFERRQGSGDGPS
jgi:hypothetical protein